MSWKEKLIVLIIGTVATYMVLTLTLGSIEKTWISMGIVSIVTMAVYFLVTGGDS